MINGNDGGATVTFDGGETWSSIMNQPTAQFYRVSTDNQSPFRIYGGQQDNTTVRSPAAVTTAESGWRIITTSAAAKVRISLSTRMIRR